MDIEYVIKRSDFLVSNKKAVSIYDKDGLLGHKTKPSYVSVSAIAKGKDCDIVLKWYKDGLLHRDKGPASISFKVVKYQHEEVVQYHYRISYYKNGKMHRDDGPAFFYGASSEKSEPGKQDALYSRIKKDIICNKLSAEKSDYFLFGEKLKGKDQSAFKKAIEDGRHEDFVSLYSLKNIENKSKHHYQYNKEKANTTVQQRDNYIIIYTTIPNY